MEEKKELTKELKKEFKHQKVIVYPGPKQQLKAVMTVILTLSLIFGISLLGTKKLTTGYTVFAYNSANWPAVVLLLIPLLLVLYWLSKR